MATLSYFISLDIGTQGSKAAVVDQYGQIVSRSFEASNLIQPRQGVVEQDPQEMLASALTGIKKAVIDANIDSNRVVAIGLDGQMAGLLGIDESGNAVTPYDSWLDTRCEKYMPMIKEWGEEAFISITGCPVTYAHGPKILWWKHERPDVYDRIKKFITPTAYIAGKLAGLTAEQAYVDYTHLHFTGFADVEQKIWSETLLNAFQVDRSKMPRIVDPWDVVGTLQRSIAEYCGLPEGTPIVAGCGDTAANILGAGVTSKGNILDVAGTASVLSCCVDEYNPDTENKTLIYARSVLPSLWTPLAYINGGGQCLEWFKDMLGREGGQFSFDELNQGAGQIQAGSHGLYFIPHFAGRVCPNNPSLRGSWIGLGWSQDKYSMFRSILESIAYEYRYYLDIILKSSSRIVFSNVNVVGGGAKSELFNRIKADVLNVSYTTLETSDSAVLANVAIAGYGIGFFDDISSAMNSMIRKGQSILPNGESHSEYRVYADQYQALLNQLTPIYQSLKDENNK
jgi:xylulokinase